MNFTSVRYNGLLISYTVCSMDDIHRFSSPGFLPRAEVSTTQYWGGHFNYEKPDGSLLANMTRGTLGIDLPDFPEAGIYTVRAMEEGAEYFCIAGLNAEVTTKKRLNLNAGESYSISKGHIAIIDDNTKIELVVAQNNDAIIQGPCKGLEVWI